MGRPKGKKNIKQEILKEDNPDQTILESIEYKETGLNQQAPIEERDESTLSKEEPKKKTKEELEREMKLNEVLKGLNKKLGKGSIKIANEIEIRERLPFKQKKLNDFTGGGIPAGTFTCFWGPKSTSKTTIVLDMIAKNQANGKVCAYINGERSYDPDWAKKRGIDTEKLIVIDVETLEEGLDTIIKLCREKVVDFIVLDSIHGIAPHAEMYAGKAETEKSTADANMALRARSLTQFFEMATAFVAEAKCAVLLIAQARMDLGGYIKLETLTGGHALLHNCRIILKFKRGQKADAPTEKRETGGVTEKGNPEMETVQVGFDFVARVDKSQVEGCIEFSEIHLPFYFNVGLQENG